MLWRGGNPPFARFAATPPKFFARNSPNRRLGWCDRCFPHPLIDPPTRMASADPEVIADALAGNAAAFEMIIRVSSSRLFAISYGILQSVAEAEDAVQESFIKAWRLRGQVSAPAKFQPWLDTIARNTARDHFRRRRPTETTETLEQTPSPTAAPDEHCDGAEFTQTLHAALASLPEEHRVAVTLRYLEEMDYRSIMSAMDLTDGALRGILGRALATLRTRLKPALAAFKG